MENAHPGLMVDPLRMHKLVPMQLKKIATISIAAVASLAMTACGTDNGTEAPAPAVTAGSPTEVEPTDAPAQTETPVESTESPAEPETPAETTEPGAAEPDAGHEAGSVEDATNARELALEHVLAEAGAEGVVIDQDLENRDGRWDVDVLVGDEVYEVKVHTVDRTAMTDDVEGADGDDRAAAMATITIGEAIEAALAHTPGIVEDASWSDDDPIGWEIEVVPAAGGDDVEIDVDPTSGEVVGTD